MNALEGFVDLVLPTKVTGWAWNPNAPGARQEIRIEIDGVVVARTTANIFRPDLLADGKGDGKYGFAIALDPPVPVSRDNFRCLAGEPTRPLKIGAKAFHAPAEAPPPPEHDESTKPAFPVFIIGSPRSGTSILSAALRAAGYSGYDEGHLLSLIRRVLEIVDAHFDAHDMKSSGELLSHVDKEKLKLGMALVLKTFQEAVQSGEPWIDKTPGTDMYFAAPYIREFWPKAKFIFAKRRGIENIVSRMKKFPEAPFAHHCEDWVSTMSGWRALRDTGLDHIEIDQMDIARKPEMVAERLGDFLNLPESAIDAIAREMTHSHPEAASADSPQKVYSLNSTNWTEDEIATFRAACAAEMDAFGYTEDETYRRE